jgi:hypothetical protein
MGNIWTEPAISGHDTKEEAEAYDVWFREEVRLALEEEGEDIPHDEAVAWMRARIAERRKVTNDR